MYLFTNIGGFSWLSVCLIAEDTSLAVKKFNNLWGEHVRYDVRAIDEIPVATQVLS